MKNMLIIGAAIFLLGFLISCNEEEPEDDTTPPTVTDVSPANGATDVDVSTTIVVTFSEFIDETSVTANGILVGISGTTSLSGTFAFSGGSRSVVTFTPSEDLAFDTEYLIEIRSSVTDTSGNELGGLVQRTFTTAAETQ